MAEITRGDIDHLASLARIFLSDNDRAILAKDLPSIIDFVDQLSLLAKKQVDIQPETVTLSQLRADEPSQTGLTIEEIRKLAPKISEDSQLKVPAVFGEPDVS